MSQSNTNYSGGVSILGLLGVAFVVLKLCGVINWSWWWVLLPFYGPLALAHEDEVQMTIWAAFCILSLLWIAAVAIIAGVALAFTYLVG